MNSGKGLSIFILVIAAAAAGFAWVHHRSRGQQALAYWGGDNARLIRTADQVQMLRLRPRNAVASLDGETDSAPRLSAWPQLGELARSWSVDFARDISEARGLVHARQALIEDASFDWSEPPDQLPSPSWQYALVFDQADRTLVVVLDLTQELLRDATGDKPPVRIRIADGMREFLREHEEADEREEDRSER